MAKYKSSEVAAKWWSAHLNGLAKQDNGESSVSELAMVAALLNAVPEEKREEFRVALEERVDEKLSLRGDCDLGVEYDAYGVLRDVAMQVGIGWEAGRSAFPIKTSMAVGKTAVKLWYGYGAEPEYLYKEEPVKTPVDDKKSGGGKNTDGGRV